MEQLLEWIDGISFSRPKRNLARDFSDGVLVAEILRQYHPRLVQLHNYPPASALNAKFNNWKTLNGTFEPTQKRSFVSCGLASVHLIYKASLLLFRGPSKESFFWSIRSCARMREKKEQEAYNKPQKNGQLG